MSVAKCREVHFFAVNPMSEKEETCGNELHQKASNDEDQEPTSLEIAVRKIVKREAMQEDVAEKLTFVYARDGKVTIPRTNATYRTDADRVLLAGTEDYVFKTFIEGPLRGLFDAITKNEARAWKMAKGSRRQRDLSKPVYELSKLGQQVVACCRSYQSGWADAYIHHVFPPWTTIMLRAMRLYAASISRRGEPSKLLTQDEGLTRAIDRMIHRVRRARSSWKFINAVRAHDRQAQDNFDSARDYIYYQAGRHSKLLILRLDLYYRPYYEVEQADKEIDGFLRWLRSNACKRNLLPGYLGFLIKRENGLVRGMHWHLMVVGNGNEHRSAHYITQRLGEIWARRTGQGPGSFHNCYADRHKYDFNGLGLLELHDWEMMAGLRAALWYMTKADCVIKATNNKERNFWRSLIPKQARRKMGRPRADADPLKLLRRMLDGKRSKYPPGIDPRRVSQRGKR